MTSHQFWVKHFKKPNSDLLKAFLTLTVNDCERILQDMGFSAEGGAAHESAENRVFSFKDTVVKFYKPDRWDKKAIEEELQFLEDLREANVPFARPIGEVGNWKGLNYLVAGAF